MSRSAPTQQAASRSSDRHLANFGGAREIVYRRPCEAMRAR